MQRLILAVLFLGAIAAILAVLVLGVRATVRDGGAVPRESEGGPVQKLAFAALFLMIAGVSTGLLGGL